MPPMGPVVHGFAAEQRQERSGAHCWSVWQGAPIPSANTMMKPACVLVTTMPVEPKPHSVTSNGPGVLKVWDGAADGSSGVPSPKRQRYWLTVVVVMGTNWTVKGAVPLQDGTLGSSRGQFATVKSTARGSGPTSAGRATSGGALSGPASTTGDGMLWHEASRRRERRTRRHIQPKSIARRSRPAGNPSRSGWTRGIEPPAVGATVRCSTIELRPPESPLRGTEHMARDRPGRQAGRRARTTFCS